MEEDSMRSYGKFLFSMLMAAIALSIFSCGGKDGAAVQSSFKETVAAPRMAAKSMRSFTPFLRHG